MKLEHSYNVDGDINHYLAILIRMHTSIHTLALNQSQSLSLTPWRWPRPQFPPGPLPALYPTSGSLLPPGFCQASEHSTAGLPDPGLSPWGLKSLFKAHICREASRGPPCHSQYGPITLHTSFQPLCVCGLWSHPPADSTLCGQGSCLPLQRVPST